MGASAPIDTSFNARMRSYMIQDHQEFLLHLAQRSIRGFVQSYRREATRLTASAEEEKEEEEEKESKGDAIPDPDPASSPFSARAARRHALSELFVAYDAAVLALKRWRDAHIIIVTQYVIVPARALNGANEPGARTYVQVDKRTGEATEVARESKPVRGTGGTSLIPLLKIYRNNTLGRLFGHR
jgi:indoleamine 2,3-dioxygenase